MSKPLVSIIVLNWNGKDSLKKYLESLKKVTFYKNYKVIVVDNNSTDGSIEILKSYRWVKLIKNRKNVSAPTAMNQGIKKARGKYLIHSDNDIEFIQKEWLDNLVDIMESDSSISSIGCQLLASNSKTNYQNKVRYVDNVCGSLMMIRKNVIDEIGNFDDKNFNPVYGDETDWNYRSKKFGYKNAEALNTAVITSGTSDSKQSRGTKFSYFLTNKHRLRAMLYNLSLINLFRRIPGLGLIFINSIPQGTTHLLVKSYLDNFGDLKKIMVERKKRNKMIKLHF